MPRNVTVTLQDGSTHVYQNVPDDVTPDAVSARVQTEFGAIPTKIDGGRKPQGTAATMSSGPQPGFMDRMAASPIGRFAHDAIAAPIQAVLPILGGIADSELGLNDAVGHPLGRTGAETVSTASEAAYQGALSRNRNTPGYQSARQLADAQIAARGGSGVSDQILAPFTSAAAGVGGGLFGGSFDAMNAASDAQAASQGAFSGKHPIISLAAGLAGGLALGGPSGVAPRSAALTALRPTVTPTDAALGYVARQVGTPADLRAFAAASGNKPVMAAEATKPGQVALGALARREGSTADALGGAAKARTLSAPTRIMDDYAAASGIHPMAARGDIEGFIEANQKAATPLYTEAYKANTNISSPMLDRILETPAGKKALADARVKMQNDMSLMGTPDADLMEQAIEGGTALPAKGAASGMKLRVYDYVKRSLDDQIGTAYRAGNKNEGNILKDLKNKMVSELDKADITAKAGPNSTKPEGGAYARARATAGEYLSAKKQFELGQQQILDDKFPAQDFAAHVKKLGEAEQQAYMGGVANKLFNIQQSGKLKADIFKSPGIRQKLSTVMGRDKADAFIRNMETEQKMAEFVRLRAPGAGSPTAEYQQAMIDQDGASGFAMDALKLGGDAVTQGPVRAVTNLAVGKAKDAMASYITRGMAVPVRDEAGRLFMLPPDQLANILSAIPASSVPQQALRLPNVTPRGALPLGLFGASGQLSSVSGR